MSKQYTLLYYYFFFLGKRRQMSGITFFKIKEKKKTKTKQSRHQMLHAPHADPDTTERRKKWKTSR